MSKYMVTVSSGDFDEMVDANVKYRLEAFVRTEFIRGGDVPGKVISD